MVERKFEELRVGGSSPSPATEPEIWVRLGKTSGAFDGQVPKWLRGRSAKPLFNGSNPFLPSMRIKRMLCLIFGHKPKEHPPLKYWIGGRAVDSPIKPIFCERCGAGMIDMIIDKMGWF